LFWSRSFARDDDLSLTGVLAQPDGLGLVTSSLGHSELRRISTQDGPDEAHILCRPSSPLWYRECNPVCSKSELFLREPNLLEFSQNACRKVPEIPHYIGARLHWSFVAISGPLVPWHFCREPMIHFEAKVETELSVFFGCNSHQRGRWRRLLRFQ
jgi:hypothetical protein